MGDERIRLKRSHASLGLLELRYMAFESLVARSIYRLSCLPFLRFAISVGKRGRANNNNTKIMRHGSVV